MVQDACTGHSLNLQRTILFLCFRSGFSVWQSPTFYHNYFSYRRIPLEIIGKIRSFSDQVVILFLVPYVKKNEKASYSNVRYSTRLSVFLCCFTPHALRIPSVGIAAKAHANCFSFSSFRLLISSFYNTETSKFTLIETG